MIVRQIVTEKESYYLAEHRNYSGRLVVAEGKCRQSAMDACLRLLFNADKKITRAHFDFPPLRVVK